MNDSLRSGLVNQFDGLAYRLFAFAGALAQAAPPLTVPVLPFPEPEKVAVSAPDGYPAPLQFAALAHAVPAAPVQVPSAARTPGTAAIESVKADTIISSACLALMATSAFSVMRSAAKLFNV